MADEMIGGYRLVKHMATGQTTQVFEVVEPASGRHFAMKMLLPEKAGDAGQRRTLFHEAEVGKLLSHPNIIRIVAIIRDPATPAFVMEFFPAGSLRARLVPKRQDAYLREKIDHLIKQGATALAFMNSKGWLHRDVKPDNFLANHNGDVRLIDFALATLKPTGFQKLLWRRQKGVGTRSYMSPEQIRGLPLDQRADIYSFGATIYELATNRPPFRGMSEQDLLAKHITERPQSPRQFNADVTEEFSQLVLHLLAKKKEDRPKDFHEVLMALRNVKVYKEDDKKT